MKLKELQVLVDDDASMQDLLKERQNQFIENLQAHHMKSHECAHLIWQLQWIAGHV